jgi:CRISPR-associated protein Cmr2
MKYSAINIGPIIGTLSMARKPRELWAASFLFSHLMKCIYAEAEQARAIIISPAKPEQDKNKVGIYPDRIYIKGETDIKTIIREAIWTFYEDLYNAGKRSTNNPDLDYFNVMSATCEAEKESTAIATLNQRLDVLELCYYAADKDAAQTIYNIISKKAFSSLFELATGEDKLPIPELEKVASIQRNGHPEIKEKSHHRYFCIVQADGDNVGKTVSHKDLKDGEVLRISKELVGFGIKASQKIEEFGGLPIYAGGDDLLFIAPVIGEDGSHIFSLLDVIETDAFKGVQDVVNSLDLKDKDDNKIEASLSFGVSISYYKYPLYEALETARNLLFGKAKNIEQKKAVAWSLRKHSGGTFDAAFSLKDETLKKQFSTLINATTDNDTVSAIAHKLRQEEALVDIVLASRSQDRLDALFDKVLEFDKDKADYFNAVKAIMPTLYKVVGKKGYIQTLYSLLRTAKFIKGEDLHDE